MDVNKPEAIPINGKKLEVKPSGIDERNDPVASETDDKNAIIAVVPGDLDLPKSGELVTVTGSLSGMEPLGLAI